MKVFVDEEYNKKTTFSILAYIMVFSAIIGFIYETIFYKIDLGYFVKRGSTFGPWIPIYAFGGLFITLFTYRFKNKPFLVFLINCFVTGILEYLTGLVLYECFNMRLWDYNTEIWNFGNINGYICLRSVLLFGVSSLFIINLMIPLLKKLIKNPKATIVSYILISTFALDIIMYFLTKSLNI